MQRIPPQYGSVLGVASAGAVLALAVGYTMAVGLHHAFVAAFDLPRSVHVPPWLAGGVFYGGVAAVVVAGAVLAVRVALRDAPRIRRTATQMILMLPPASGAAIAAAAAFGGGLDYPLTPLVIGTEAAIVLTAFLGATALARRWSVTAAG